MDVDDLQVGLDELLVEVYVCSVNFFDILIIQGFYQFKFDLFFFFGSDIVGKVLVVGENVKGFQFGDEVVVFVLYGGFVEKMVVKVNVCFFKFLVMGMVEVVVFFMVYGIFYYVLVDCVKFQ